MSIGLSCKKNIIRNVVILALLALLIQSVGYLCDRRPVDIFYHYTLYSLDKSELARRYNIDIEGALTQNNHIVDKEGNPLVGDQAVIEPVKNKYDISRASRIIIKTLEKYPAIVIQQYLKQIILLDELIVHGSRIDGTYDVEKKSIYLRNTYIEHKSISKNKAHLITAVNHEISSLLMAHNSFDESDWRVAMGKGFQYENDKDPWYQWKFVGGYIEPDEFSSENELLQRGLLRQYAETGVENDFNTYAEVIFGDPKRMRRFIKDYPVIARKYHVFKEFYLSIDSGFAPVFEKVEGGDSNLVQWVSQMNEPNATR